MRHVLRLGFLVLAIALIGATHAEAKIWDWLEELNGPGPSGSRGNFMFNIFCSGTSSAAVPQFGRWFQIPRESNARETCLYVDRRWFHADEDARFYPVNVTITEFGPSFRLHPAIELGAGAGWMSFSSKDGVTNEEFEGTNFTITFSRLALKPILIAPARRSNPDWGFLQFYIRETVVVGELTQDDFASKPGTTFSRKNQRLSSMGFLIDVPSGLRLLKRALNRP
jgi:hypothetical protein